MPFVNLDDNFPDHPKVDGLSDGAFRLHVAGICYANRQRTNGFIPVSKVERLTRTYKPRQLSELMEARMWLPADQGYTIHDFLEWNRSREQIAVDRERIRHMRSEAGKKGAQARWSKG